MLLSIETKDCITEEALRRNEHILRTELMTICHRGPGSHSLLLFSWCIDASPPFLGNIKALLYLAIFLNSNYQKHQKHQHKHQNKHNKTHEHYHFLTNMSNNQQSSSSNTGQMSDYEEFLLREKLKDADRIKSMPKLNFRASDYRPPEQDYRDMRASEVQHDQRKEDRERRRMERSQAKGKGVQK